MIERGQRVIRRAGSPDLGTVVSVYQEPYYAGNLMAMVSWDEGRVTPAYLEPVRVSALVEVVMSARFGVEIAKVTDEA